MGVNQFIAQGIMRYIINNNIKYHEDRSELISLHDDIPPIVLTATLNRLLSALVRNNNLVLSRETLLTQVWEAHGQVASGNNLNNTISILRKAFSSLGEEEIIVTLPRQGFMFTARELKTVDSLAESLLEVSVAGAGSTSPVVSKRVTHFKHIGLGALLLLTAGSGIWAWQDAGYAPLSAVSVGNIGSCEVKFVASYHKAGPGKVDLVHLKNMLEQDNSVRCSEPAMLLYYDSESVVSDAVGRVRASYFFYCPQAEMAAGKVQCENYYESRVK
ncbi:TPA: transcriptional regulator [Serratia marcescens]